MAGSASVAPQPRTKTTASTPGSGSWRGRCVPSSAARGITPILTPSMKMKRPMTTVTSPKSTWCAEYRKGWRGEGGGGEARVVRDSVGSSDGLGGGGGGKEHKGSGGGS